jgi:uncharacterized protein involved in exopolysaccharide biosynthesis
MGEITLEFISRQLERVLAEQGAQRDEMLVLGARMSRLEASVAVIATEVHALANQLSRMNDRLVRLERV